MTPLFSAALQLQEFLDKQRWPSCIIGGLAVLRWGEPRFTRDVDVTLLTGFGQEDAFIQPLVKAYRSRIPDAAEFASRNRVLLLESEQGVPLDIALGALPYESMTIERATEYEFEPGCRLRTCSAEDLVIQKLFALRPRDVIDVEGVVARMRGRLDWSFVESSLAELAELKGEPAIMRTLARVRG